jgi:hypothetical protein
MLKIGDLIEIPAVKTVIELASVRDTPENEQKMLEDIAATFVVTDDIKLHLETILQSIIKNEGRGFFLSGSFGSGKSHFLATLSLLLNYPQAWVPIVAQEPTFETLELEITKNKYAVIQVPLLEFRATESLETILLQTIERTLNRRFGLNLVLSDEDYFLEMFERYVLPACRTDVNAFIQKEVGPEFNWQILKNEPKDLVRLMRRFLDQREEAVPFQLTPQRMQAFDKLTQTLAAHHFSGMVILLDELSEFLKSKSSSTQLNEDARFLQFIGERSLNQPLWIIGALQEAIEKTGDIQKSVFDKIKDRYRTRLELSTRHIRELIDRRLVLKNERAPQALKEAYTILKTSFNNIPITEDLFFQIYPVHPECLEILDLSEGLFSQRRGVVDFVHYQLKGDTSRHIPGMLNADYLNLLTPDKIFDHFYVQIKENPQTSQFYTLYRDHFQKRIPQIFENKADADCALQVIKILILLEVLPVRQKRNVQELANMLLYRSTEFSLGDINYEYFEEALLKRLEGELGYLKVEPHEGRFKNIYQIDLAATARDVIGERIKTYQNSIKGNHREMVEVIFPETESVIFPWGQMLNVESHRNYLKWMHSIRQGRVILADVRDFDPPAISRILNRLETTEDDFFVILAYPFDQQEQLAAFRQIQDANPLNRFRNGVVCILPGTISPADWEKLERYYATLLVLEDFQPDDSDEALEIKARLKDDLAKLQRDARNVLDTAYSNAVTCTTAGRDDHAIRQITDQNFDAILTRVIHKPLESVYPLFHIIAPLEEISGYSVLKELLNQLIQPGGIEDLNHPQYRLIRHAIDNIALPLGIAEIKGRRCLLQSDIKFSAGLKALSDLVPTKEPVSCNELFFELRNSEYGMNQFIFDLFLIVLLRKGHLVAQQGEQSINFMQLQFPLYKYVDFVTRGQLIGPELREKLIVVGKNLLREDLSDYDIQKQELAWLKLREFQERAVTFLERVRLKMQILRQKYDVTEESVPYTFAALKNLERLNAAINRTLSSRPGLEKFLTSIDQPEQLRFTVDQMRSLNRFFETELTEFDHIFNYMHSPQLAIPHAKAYEDLHALRERIHTKLNVDDNLLLEEGIRYLRGLFNDFLDIYKSRYAQEHEIYNRAIDVAELRRLQADPDYQMLERLSRLKIISVQDDFSKIQKQVEKHLARACELPVSDSLDHFAQCRCGFQLGKLPEPVELAPIRQALQSGIRQYLQTLQETGHHGQIEKYLNHIQKTQQAEPEAGVRKLLNLNPQADWPALAAEVQQQLTENVVHQFNQALTSDVKIVTRNIDELRENLVDRRYPLQKIRQIFEAWLKGPGMPEDAYVEIRSEKEL